MKKADLHRMKVLDVLGLYVGILDNLWQRGIVRSVNNPVADYAEHLVCDALSLVSAQKSAEGFDATDTRDRKYEIKPRRETKHSKPTRFSAIRDLDSAHFDFLVAVLFAEDFSVKRAGILSRAAVKRMAFRQEHVNGWILPLSNSLWCTKGVTAITAKLRKAQLYEEESTTRANGRGRLRR